MEIIVTRSRIAGTLPHYEYRALISADAVAETRRRRACLVKAPKVAGFVRCLRTGPVIAPERYFELDAAAREILGSRISALARQIDALIVRFLFPEVTAQQLRPIITIDDDPGDACVRTDIADLTGAYDRLAARHDVLTTSDLGLREDCARRAA
ncbi:hypothetical protein K3M67_06575 [Sphingobium sp. V4]|uniref:hypothetical protein n=1 Tax=Sphingobium sp. V4 TaxID=3038927 RepID=UPI00255828F5|nr:hypothetical protein [Sphingobium sp. V4]WIW89617.1 hypothetical protein K3M67_06575 [Sphingobium sp. V4]